MTAYREITYKNQLEGNRNHDSIYILTECFRVQKKYIYIYTQEALWYNYTCLRQQFGEYIIGASVSEPPLVDSTDALSR